MIISTILECAQGSFSGNWKTGRNPTIRFSCRSEGPMNWADSSVQDGDFFEIGKRWVFSHFLYKKSKKTILSNYGYCSALFPQPLVCLLLIFSIILWNHPLPPRTNIVGIIFLWEQPSPRSFLSKKRWIPTSHIVGLHPRRLTWNLKIMVWKMIFLFQGYILRFHVNLRGCTSLISASQLTTWPWSRLTGDLHLGRKPLVFTVNSEGS